MAISKHIRKAMSESYHEYWGQFPASERDMIRRDLKRKGKHSLTAIELFHLKGLLARRGEVEDWIQKIDGHMDYEENKHEIIATYGEPLPGEETDAEAREKMEEVETEHRDYIIKNIEEAIEAEKVGKKLPFEYATIDDFVTDIRRDMILTDDEIEDVLRPTPAEVKEAIAKLPRAVQFEFGDMKRSLDMVTGDVEKLTKTVKKFVTKKDLKRELEGMEDRMTERITEKMTEKIGVITTEQIRKELQRLREEYARLPPVEVPPEVPEIPPKIEIIEEEIVEVPEEEVSKTYERAVSRVEVWRHDAEHLKKHLMNYKKSPVPLAWPDITAMSNTERLKMVEIIVDKLITIIPETEEGISNIEDVQSKLMAFDIPDALKKKLIETLDGAELARYSILV